MDKNLGNFINGNGSYSDPYIIEILNKKSNRHVSTYDEYILFEKDLDDTNFKNKKRFNALKKVCNGIIYLLFFLFSFVIIPSLLFFIWG